MNCRTFVTSVHPQRSFKRKVHTITRVCFANSIAFFYRAILAAKNKPAFKTAAPSWPRHSAFCQSEKRQSPYTCLQPASFSTFAQKFKVEPVVITSSKTIRVSGRRSVLFFTPIFPFKFVSRSFRDKDFCERPSARYRHRTISNPYRYCKITDKSAI